MDNEKYLDQTISSLCDNLSNDDIHIPLTLMNKAAQIYDSINKSADDKVIIDCHLKHDNNTNKMIIFASEKTYNQTVAVGAATNTTFQR